MIHDVDESLRELARRDVLNGAGVDISFEAPTKEWSSRRNSPSLNFYLYEIREDLTRREIQFEEIRNAEGIVIERVLPPRKFKLSYLVTAWTQRPEDEHRLLAAVISCFIRFDALPTEILQGELAHQPYPLRVTVGLPLPAERSISDIWSALGGELKPSLDLVITAPFVAGRHRAVGPPVLEEPRIGIFGPNRAGEDAVRKGGGKGKRPPVHGASDATRPRREPPPAATETVDPGEGKPGRRLTVRTLPDP